TPAGPPAALAAPKRWGSARLPQPPEATWPSGKARVCKTLIRRFESARRLQTNPLKTNALRTRPASGQVLYNAKRHTFGTVRDRQPPRGVRMPTIQRRGKGYRVMVRLKGRPAQYAS